MERRNLILSSKLRALFYKNYKFLEYLKIKPWVYYGIKHRSKGII